MLCTLTVVRYPKYFGFAGAISMAVFRLPLWLNKEIAFWKLMGCGRNGSFDKTPDWRQWAVLMVSGELSMVNELSNLKSQIPNFLHLWWKFFHAEVFTIALKPIEGHGTWDGKKPFGDLPKKTAYEGLTAVLTRATIRPNKLKSFWANVDGVASRMTTAAGFVTSFGIGEVPFIKQATFSVWESKSAMKNFAYTMQEHKEVIQKTKKENWYSEEMFVRFQPLAAYGTLKGENPLTGKL